MMRIPVVLKDGTEQAVEKADLHQLMDEQLILFFKRTNGWIVVGRDNVRGAGGEYFGAERRLD